MRGLLQIKILIQGVAGLNLVYQQGHGLQPPVHLIYQFNNSDMKLRCVLFGHNDPVMEYADVFDEDYLYQHWLHIDRQCRRCGKDLKPI